MRQRTTEAIFRQNVPITALEFQSITVSRTVYKVTRAEKQEENVRSKLLWQKKAPNAGAYQG